MEENKKIAHIGLGPENARFKHALTYNPETHVPIPKVRWRRFSDMTQDLSDVLVIKNGVPYLCGSVWSGEDVNGSIKGTCYVIAFDWEDRWCYASEVNLSEWLPKF